MRALFPATVLACATLAACTTTPRISSQARIVTLPSRSLVISNVRADIVDDAFVVRGHVGRRALLRGPIWGHLHVEAFYGPSLVATADTRWTQLARGRLPASFFQVRLPNTARPIDVIRVSHMYADHRKARASGNPS